MKLLTVFRSKPLIVPFFVAVSLIYSCKDKEPEKMVEEAPIQNTLEANKAALERAAPASTSSSPNTVALNPPHGQPGHRCDIKVGEPLNTPINKSTTPTSIQDGVSLNPPHGQPGHRCDIKVGDPL